MGIRRFDGGHLPPLHLGYAAIRVEDEDVDRLPIAASFECGRSGVARGGADDRHMLMLLRQRRIEQWPHKLQCQILEREGRSVKQLQQPQPFVDLHQRGYRAMAEALTRSL